MANTTTNSLTSGYSNSRTIIRAHRSANNGANKFAIVVTIFVALESTDDYPNLKAFASTYEFTDTSAVR